MARPSRRFRTQEMPPVVSARPEAVAELGQLRRRELEVLSDRLGRVDQPDRATRWTSAGVVWLSVALGALVAGIPLLNSRSNWDGWVIPVYASAIGVSLLIAALCGLAGRSVRRARAESVTAIKTDLDSLLSAYEVPDASPEVHHDVLRHFLQRVRVEVRDNQRLVQQAHDHGRYWKVTEAAPSTKEWKNNSAMLADEAGLEATYEKGREAAAEVERVLTARSFRMFRGGRVRQDDRLGEALQVLREFDEFLTHAMDNPPPATPVA